MNSSTINSYLVTPLGFAILFIALWSISGLLIGFLTGWLALARRFRAQAEPYGDAKTAGPFFYTVYMRFWTHYSSVIRLTAAGDALYLSVLFLFRIGHPPLRIPWNEIRFGRARRLFFPYIVLTLGSEEQILMRIPERMARKLGILDRLPTP
jgi:hypothetical protein